MADSSQSTHDTRSFGDDAKRRTAIRRALLRWYRAHHRQLPWRASPGNGGHPDPYHVLVSEAMLQQTQVATVIDYFNRFMTRYPTVESLAIADEQAVLYLWQGLGYYRRARNLHRAARMIVDEFAGRVPDRIDDLLRLPGVGRYTAGAIASIGYDRPEPILDGNVARILARLFLITSPLTDRATQTILWELAEIMLPKRGAGDFNQSMMELGATVCLPRGPHCLTCPVSRHCAAYAAGAQEDLPDTGKKTKQKEVTHRVFIISSENKYLIEQRGDTGLWSGMWQFPTIEHETDTTPPIKNDLKKLMTGFNFQDCSQPETLMTFRHMTTHRRITFEVYCFTIPSTETTSLTRATLEELSAYPMSNPQRKVVSLLIK